MRLLATTIAILFVMSLPLGEAQAQKDTASGTRFYKEGEMRVKEWDLFYHDHMDGSAVRLRNMSLDSLPDELVLRLITDSTPAENGRPRKSLFSGSGTHRARRGRIWLLRGFEAPQRARTPLRAYVQTISQTAPDSQRRRHSRIRRQYRTFHRPPSTF